MMNFRLAAFFVVFFYLIFNINYEYSNNILRILYK